MSLTEMQRNLIRTADGNLTRREVADITGQTMGAVAMMACDLRKRGYQISFRDPKTYQRRSAVRARINAGGFETGARQIAESLSANTAEWLINQIPEGGTLTDIIRAIINDAYAEDHHQ